MGGLRHTSLSELPLPLLPTPRGANGEKEQATELHATPARGVFILSCAVQEPDASENSPLVSSTVAAQVTVESE